MLSKINGKIINNKRIRKKVQLKRKNSNKNSNKRLLIYLLFIVQQLIIFIFTFNYFYVRNNNIHYIRDKELNKNNNTDRVDLDYEENIFEIVKINNCLDCGLFSYYKKFLGCIKDIIFIGHIPILDLKSYKNIYNGFNSSLSENPWEIFFSQPYGYTLNDVINKAKNIKQYYCNPKDKPDFRYGNNFFFNKIIINSWHNLAKMYIPIKDEIKNEVNSIIKRLFKDFNNVLGIMTRGTDYVAKRIWEHPIPPKPEVLIQDIKEMDRKYNYKWFFMSTEDDIIRDKLKKEFGNKIKYVEYKERINYDYKKKDFLGFNEKVRGNIEFIKIYVLNLIILSKCTDIICARTNGSIAIFIFTDGFRYRKVYNLGNY